MSQSITIRPRVAPSGRYSAHITTETNGIQTTTIKTFNSQFGLKQFLRSAATIAKSNDYSFKQLNEIVTAK